jgi:ParB family transcriptional regulator, chromosome partitioning protein
MSKRRGLGRGLDALLGDSASAVALEQGHDGELKNLPVELIRRGQYQPRTDMNPEALEELASSIRAQGVVQPIVVRAVSDGRHYEIIAGERRWRASQIAGLSEIPAVVRDVPDRAAIAIALIENIQRENLNPMEEAQAMRRLIDEFEMTHEVAAEAVGRSRATVTNLLRLLELNAQTKELLRGGALNMGHARALLGLQGETQDRAAREVAEKGLSARETERLVARLKRGAVQTDKPEKRRDPDVVRLENELAGRFGAPVRVDHNANGKGRVVISYSSLDELDGVLERIGGGSPG